MPLEIEPTEFELRSYWLDFEASAPRSLLDSSSGFAPAGGMLLDVSLSFARLLIAARPSAPSGSVTGCDDWLGLMIGG